MLRFKNLKKLLITAKNNVHYYSEKLKAIDTYIYSLTARH